MDRAILALSVIAVLVLVAGAFGSARVGQAMSFKKSSETGEQTKRHPILKNPIVWVYIVAAAIVLFYIGYLFTTTNLPADY
ncbi:hypothetical protein G4V62_05405 [Bacillaceae bacterium SIJ1]|uniref:hypothetical protein n=1 Tax=Litoribacterium kuwaitense TaxID=1398745 RepID=UPI0013EC9901|nr:hypothetical protein [Litoribacterium kuwaitense]NGP44417.1 hypothetical protein [Litoribacterium kuwaitense]